MSKTILDLAREQREALIKPANDVVAAAEAESRGITDDELAIVRDAKSAAEAIDARIAELTDLAERNAAAAKSFPTISVRNEPHTYSAHGEFSHIRDTILATQRNDQGAWERLKRHAQEVRVESRDITRVDGSAGEFVPPLWLVDMFGDFPRAGRVAANLVSQLPLPAGTDSINLPRITTGPQVAVQTADNGAVQETDMVTATVTAPVRTIAGQQDVAIQLIEQSPLAGGIDKLIYNQLLADYERALGLQIWNGSGASGQVTGILGTSGIGSVTFTTGSPTVPLTYTPLAQAINSVHTNSFIPATALVMHPRRWNWITAALDGQNRPFVVPVANGPYMAGGVVTNVAAQGYVGTILGLPVYVDATIPTTLGAGTNEDRIFAGDLKQSYLMEGAVKTRVLPDVLSGNLTVRFQLYRYVAFTSGVRPTAVAAISGTGLTAPSGF